MLLRDLRWLGIGLVAALSCVRCGVPVCAFGAGDCEKMYANAPGSTQGNGNVATALVLTASSQIATVGNAISITATGATACPNGLFTVTWTPNDSTHQIDTDFKSKFIFKGAGDYKVTISDCGRPVLTGSISITAK